MTVPSDCILYIFELVSSLLHWETKINLLAQLDRDIDHTHLSIAAITQDLF